MIERHKNLKSLNTFGIDVKAKWYAEYTSPDELRDILTIVHAEYSETNPNGNPLRILHIGGGSNLLFLEDYEGLVLHSGIRGIEILDEDESSITIKVGAGMVWDDLVEESLHNGWYGLENLTAIPGEVGAAAVQNIGAYGAEAKDFITSVHLVDLQTLVDMRLTNAELCYGYRYSSLKSKELWGRYAVTFVELKLNKIFSPKLEYGGLKQKVEAECGVASLEGKRLRNMIKEMRDGKLPDPKVLGNAGSFFMNPVVDREVYDSLARQYEGMPHYEVDAGHVKIPAGWLIDKAGWKGKSLGNAGVYERQALVLVNLGDAKGQDIVNLCETIKHDVKVKFGIDIHPEVNFITNS